MDPDEPRLATVELLGALTYGQLRSFAATAQTVAIAPTISLAERIADLAIGEYERHVRLRTHLETQTELPAAVMDRQRPRFDAYFDRAPLGDWFGACAFFALGLPIASDFARAVAPVLDERTADVVVAALDRGGLQQEALERCAVQLTTEEQRDRARHLAADLLGRALTGFQAVMSDTDALDVLFATDGDDVAGPQHVRQLAMTVLEGHRRRVVELGLEGLDDVS
ncbi:MAG: ferritin-like fold-containing protein [Nitriliruptoraceae bacterium]